MSNVQIIIHRKLYLKIILLIFFVVEKRKNIFIDYFDDFDIYSKLP